MKASAARARGRSTASPECMLSWPASATVYGADSRRARDEGRSSDLQDAFVKGGRRAVRHLHAGFLDGRDALSTRSNLQPGEGEIRESIAGNVCRCTGYQRIESIRHAVKERTSRGRRARALPVRTPGYARRALPGLFGPRGTRERTVLLAGGNGLDRGARPCAAGEPGRPAARARRLAPARAARHSGRERACRDGDAATFLEIRSHPVLLRRAPVLSAMAREVGAIQIQARGGRWAGNLATASPAADGAAASWPSTPTSFSRVFTASGGCR